MTIKPPPLTTTTTGEITLKIQDWRRWPEFAPTWDRIHGQCHSASFFVSSIWVDCWLQTFGEELKPDLIVFECDGEVVGCCLLVSRTELVHGIPLRRVYLNCAGEDAADSTYIEYNTLLCLPGYEVMMAESLTAHLRRRRWDVLLLPGFVDHGDAMRITHSLGQGEVEKRPAPCIDLDRVRAAGGDFTSGLSANARSAIRRSLRTYESLGGATGLHFAQDMDEALSMLDELAEHHRETWSARGQPGCFASAKFTAFHRRLIRNAFDNIMLVRVQAGKEVIGLLYCFVWRGCVHSYQSGFHYTLDSRRSPGLVTNYCVITECTRRTEIREFDLMAGETRYKRSLAGDSKSRPMYWHSIYRNTISSRLYRFLRSIKRKYL